MIDDFRPMRPKKKSLESNTNISSSKVPTVQNAARPATAPVPTPVAAPVVSALPQPDSAVKNTGIRLPQNLDLPESEPEKGRTKVQSVLEKLKLRWPPTRKEAIVILGVTLIVASGLGSALMLRQEAPVAATPTKTKVVKKEPPKPTTVASALSGVQVDPAVNARPVIGVMIENSVDARPQSGLGQAGVVFEAIAEGGITRFMALFQDTTPEDIGPVRSVRPYYVKWLMGFDAPIAHVGGSPEALSNIRDWGTKDLDQVSNSGDYRRVATRDAPHNVYTSYSALQQIAAAKGFTGSTFTSFVRKAESPSKTPNAKTIDMAISSSLYNTHYDYDPASNSYKRSQAGAAHIDAGTNQQISPKSVVVLVMPFSIDGKYSVYGTIGSGQAIVFQDGVATTASWVKSDNAAQFSFTDAGGKALALNPGQTWITAVGDASKVTYAP